MTTEAAPQPLYAAARHLRLLVILPTYNEAENVAPLCEELLSLKTPADVLVVDDDSPDGTADVVKRLMVAYPGRLWLESRTERLGRGDAVMHGFRFAMAHGYDFVMEMDADFSHDPRAIPQFLAHAQVADLVIGSRHLSGGGIRGWNWRRKLIHIAASLYARVLLGTPTTDHTNGFRMYRVASLVDLPLESAMAHGFVGQTLRAYLFHRNGLRIHEIPVVFHERRSGASKMSWREAISGAAKLIGYRLKSRNLSGHKRHI